MTYFVDYLLVDNVYNKWMNLVRSINAVNISDQDECQENSQDEGQGYNQDNEQGAEQEEEQGNEQTYEQEQSPDDDIFVHPEDYYEENNEENNEYSNLRTTSRSVKQIPIKHKKTGRNPSHDPEYQQQKAQFLKFTKAWNETERASDDDESDEEEEEDEDGDDCDSFINDNDNSVSGSESGGDDLRSDCSSHGSKRKLERTVVTNNVNLVDSFDVKRTRRGVVDSDSETEIELPVQKLQLSAKDRNVIVLV
jgi:hypothetical protein